MTAVQINLVLLIADLAALQIVRKIRGWTIIPAASVVLIFFSAVLALIFGHDGFDHMRWMAFAIFFHLNFFFLVNAILIFRSKKAVSIVLILFVLLLTATAIDGFLIEPKQLEQNTITIHSAKIGKPIRIVVMSDLQADSFRNYERQAFDLAVRQKPDLILLTGDYFQVDSHTKRNLIKEANDYLRTIRFKAPMGIYAVEGDVDDQDWPSLFDRLEVKTSTETESFQTNEIFLTALSRSDSRDVHLQVSPKPGFHIAFGHSPNFALGNVPADLLIAGHTHGGQIQLPFIGPLYIHSKIPRTWGSGVTNLSGGRKLIVSRGIGMERGNAPRIRFLCKPEIVVINLQPYSSPK